jgi:hypothetical protein
MTQYTIEALLEALKSDETRVVQNALKHIRLKPTGDSHIQAAIESLLSDKRITIVEIKPTVTFGELAYLAGDALTFEYAKGGKEENVVIQNTILPLGASEVHKIASDEEFKEATGTFNDKIMNLLVILDKKGKIKRGPILFVTKRAELLLKRWGEL